MKSQWNFNPGLYLLFKMLVKLVGIEIMTFLIIQLDITSAKIPIYNDVCDYIIKIGSTDQAARLKFHYNPSSGPHLCNFTIETLDGYQPDGGYFYIAYKFLDTGVQNNFKCSSSIYYDNGDSSGSLCGSNVYPALTFLTRNNRLLLIVTGDKETEFVFDMLFMSFHKDTCSTHETTCHGLLGDSDSGSGCVDYSLVCHQTYEFCEESGSCADIKSAPVGNSTLVAVLVVTLVVVFLIGVICIICYKKNKFGFLRRRDSDDVQTRAMNIFSLQLASRGVDGNDNPAATDDEGNPIDFSKFDPPPEYGSLENIDGAGVTETDGNANPDEVLPSYGDVMNNFDEYTVSTPI